MEPGRLDTFVSCGKTKRSTRKPKARRDFIGVKFFGPEKVFFHLTGTLYGWQLETPSVLLALRGYDLKPATRE
jgi:hypothetical protein